MKRFAPMLSPQAAALQAFSQAPQRQAVTVEYVEKKSFHGVSRDGKKRVRDWERERGRKRYKGFSA